MLFTAHSLPERILREGDAYPDEVRATMEAVIAGSRPGSADHLRLPEPGPLPRAVARPGSGADPRRPGRRRCARVVIAPIGFLSDHVETLYDIDIEFRARAEKLGLRLERMAMLNDSDALADTLVALVDEHLG